MIFRKNAWYPENSSKTRVKMHLPKEFSENCFEELKRNIFELLEKLNLKQKTGNA